MTRNKKIIFSIVVFLLIVLVFNLLFSGGTKQTDTSTPPQAIPEWKGIIPGQSTKDEVTEKLGVPQNEITSGNQKILTYTSHLKAYPNEVLVENEKVFLIREHVTPTEGEVPKINVFLPNPQAAPIYKYSEDYGPVISIIIYPEDGFAFVGIPQDKSVFEVWRFAPASLEQILTTWGTDLKEKHEVEESVDHR